MALAIEQRVYEANPEIVACLQRQQASLQMRALRVAVEQLDYRWDDSAGILELQARLPAGSYLTSLLGHFVDCQEFLR